ncbi:MAG: 3-dehydroquinate synthase [Bacteroidetes bacterium]|nr:3-dehydroquinate synthase [Bacteroidota bacterium]
MQAPVTFFDDLNSDFIAQIDALKASTVFILVDENTQQHCLPLLPKEFVKKATLISIQAGEENKNLTSCQKIWDALQSSYADRETLLINLGGGMVTDLGGFVAATYKRGIRFINIPTTLMGMVDAAIGGKTGINFNKIKNQIGSFSQPQMVVVYKDFLRTLPDREFTSALAEVIKYQLLTEEISNLNALFSKYKNYSILPTLISTCIAIKQRVCEEDFKESNHRKMLNLGHTSGHAIESFLMDKGVSILHGEAVAAGLVVAIYLSNLKTGLHQNFIDYYLSKIDEVYGKLPLLKEDIPALISYMHHDKKNAGNEIKFVLLRNIGDPVIDVSVSEMEITYALNFYIG